MRTTFTSLYLLALLITFADSLALKHKNGPSGRKSVVVQTPVPRSAWECHPGCKKFCLSSCKRSCCAPGAPNYSPDMFPQLVNYQASLPPPPPPPPACPTGCPSTCYPNCDAGCCFPVNQPPAYPQYPPYTGYDPCVAQSCSSACAPQCNPDCCRSQALNLSIRPVYLGSKASPATAKESPAASRKPEPSPPPPPPPKKKVALNKKPKTGIICVPQCQRLCKPVCIFKCCLPTYKFHDSQPEPKKTVKPHHVKPIASPQRAPVPKLLSQPKPTEGRVPDAQQPYADDQQSPYGEPYQNPYQADVSSYMTQQQPAVAMQQQPFPYGAVPQNLMAPYADYQGQPSPGLAPLTCPEPSCSDACAPMCSRSCCAGMAPLLPQPWDKRSIRPHKA